MEEINVIGQMDNSDGTFESANRVYGDDGIAPTIPTCGGGGVQPKVMEVKIVAMRGRDPQNPSNRTSGNPNLEQRLEPNSEGICNCITTVEKDNMVLELGHIEKGTGKHQSNIVYSKNGLSPTICASYGVKQPPAMHLESIKLGNAANSNQRCGVYDENALSPTIQAAAGTGGNQQPMWVEVKQATKQGYIPCEVGGGWQI